MRDNAEGAEVAEFRGMERRACSQRGRRGPLPHSRFECVHSAPSLRVPSASPATSAFSSRRAYVRSSLLLAITLALATLALLLWPGEDVLTGRTTVRMTVWGMPFEDRLFLDRYAKGWEALRPDIRVDYGRFADIRTKYNVWFSRGDGPEVMRMELTWYPSFVERGMLEPLDAYINDPARGLSAEQMAKFPPAVMDLLRIKGKLYALPEDTAQYGLFYNRAIFDQHNREFPDDPVEYPPMGVGAAGREWDWNDLRRVAKKLTRYENNDPVNGRITRAGFDFAIWAWPFLTLLYQAGGEAFNADGSVCTINSAAGVRALEFLRAMQREDRSFEPTLGAYTAGVGADTHFATGSTAMILDGSWRIPNLDLTAPGLDFAVAPLPRGPRSVLGTPSLLDGPSDAGPEESSTKVRVEDRPETRDAGPEALRRSGSDTTPPDPPGRPAVIWGGVLWAISSKAAHKDEAWDLLRWLVQDEQAAAYWDVLRVAPPANLAVLNSPAFRETRGVLKDPADPSKGYEVPPMPAADFDKKAVWLLYGVTPHPETGQPPGFVISHPLLGDLFDEIGRMLAEYLRPDSTTTPQAALDRVVARMAELRQRTR